MKHNDIDDFAKIAEALALSGNESPTAEDIAERYFSDEVHIPPGLFEQECRRRLVVRVKQVLPHIRERLEAKDHQCLLVCQEHYDLPSPETEAEAREHLAVGQRKGVGIYFSTKKNDVLLAAQIQKGGRMSAGYARGTAQRVIQGVQSGHIDRKRAALIIREIDQQSLPDRHADEIKRLREIPAPSPSQGDLL